MYVLRGWSQQAKSESAAQAPLNPQTAERCDLAYGDMIALALHALSIGTASNQESMHESSSAAAPEGRSFSSSTSAGQDRARASTATYRCSYTSCPSGSVCGLTSASFRHTTQCPPKTVQPHAVQSIPPLFHLFNPYLILLMYVCQAADASCPPA